MPNFSDHNLQANKNIDFLNYLISNCAEYYDWKVTVAFYTSVHIVNAHLAYVVDQHYQRHGDVENALNYANNMSPARISENTYIAYKRLHNLSRRSRYLIHEDAKNRQEERCHFISENHFKKAINRLTEIIEYFNKTYNIEYHKINIS
jgi:hypothetical protein